MSPSSFDRQLHNIILKHLDPIHPMNGLILARLGRV